MVDTLLNKEDLTERPPGKEVDELKLHERGDGTLRSFIRSHWWKPKFPVDFPEAVVREGAAEVTLRRAVEGILRTCIDTTNVWSKRW